MEKKVSVIIPVYNVQDYISECLLSVVNQTYQNLEIIAVNDGSTDLSRKELESWLVRDPRIIIIDKENGGLSDARNCGLKQASGDYISFIDGDDRIIETMIEELVKSLEENKSDIAVCDMDYFYDDGSVSYSSGGSFQNTNIQEMPHLIGINNSACNKLYRKELWRDISFPFGKYYEDLATVPIVLYKAHRVSKVSQPLYEYRQRRGSIAHAVNENIFDIYDAIDAVKDYVQAHGNEAEVMKEINHLYIVHGLDLTTLRIKDFNQKEVREEYLNRNMDRLMKSYPQFDQDEAYKRVSLRKKIIFSLLKHRKMRQVLRIYG